MSFDEEEREEPATVLLRANSGQSYDIKNLPGAKRKQLIENGEISIDAFIHADNMPGYKMQKMREILKENLGFTANTPSAPLIDINTLVEGSLVSYKNIVTEAKKISKDKGLVYIKIKGNKEGWIKVDKLKPVNIPPSEEE